MKIYKVKVNGKVYEVELEKVSEIEGSIETTKNTPQDSSGKDTVNAPLQGKVFQIPVKVGDIVNSGDVVVVIEAMKMESDVQTAKSGTVTEILVSVGNDVDTNQPLIVIE
ncbi:MAG: biotin/lipoyl-containing protein [Bacilli bacterium]